MTTFRPPFEADLPSDVAVVLDFLDPVHGSDLVRMPADQPTMREMPSGSPSVGLSMSIGRPRAPRRVPPRPGDGARGDL